MQIQTLRASPMAVSWEAIYPDGVQAERNGATYDLLDRSRMLGFRLVTPDGLVIYIEFGDQRDRDAFVYRRRTAITVGTGKTVRFIVGFTFGPWYIYQSDQGIITEQTTLEVPPARQEWEPATYW